MIPKNLQWPLACALVAVAMFSAGYLAGGRNERQGAALRAAEGRIETINDRERMTDDVQGLDDAAFGNELDGRLSPGR